MWKWTDLYDYLELLLCFRFLFDSSASFHANFVSQCCQIESFILKRGHHRLGNLQKTCEVGIWLVQPIGQIPDFHSIRETFRIVKLNHERIPSFVGYFKPLVPCTGELHTCTCKSQSVKQDIKRRVIFADYFQSALVVVFWRRYLNLMHFHHWNSPDLC